jgi:hypothetical protein
MKTGVLDNGFQPCNLGFKDFLAEAGEPVVSAAGIVVWSEFTGLFHHAGVQHFAEIVVESARPEFIFPFGLAGDFLHDSVAMTVFSG